MKEEEILALIAAPFMAAWLAKAGRQIFPTVQDYSKARNRALYQAQELLKHAAEQVHGGKHNCATS